jgi:hypothetical protein
VVGVAGRGFTVILDLALSVLEPVMELKREVSSARGIVTTCEPVTRALTKGRVDGRVPLDVSTAGSVCQVIAWLRSSMLGALPFPFRCLCRDAAAADAGHLTIR